MKKFFPFLLVLLCGMALPAGAQAPAVAEKEVSFKKQKANAFTATYSNIPEADLSAVAGIWMQKNLGGKKSKTSGYVAFTGAHWNDLNAGAPLTVYYKVDGNKKNSTLTLLVANKENHFLSSAANAQAGGKLYTFFNELNDEVAAYQKQQQINALHATLAQLENDLNKLEKKDNDLKKQKENLERDMDNNEKAISELSGKINTARGMLAELSK